MTKSYLSVAINGNKTGNSVLETFCKRKLGSISGQNGYRVDSRLNLSRQAPGLETPPGLIRVGNHPGLLSGWGDTRIKVEATPNPRRCPHSDPGEAYTRLQATSAPSSRRNPRLARGAVQARSCRALEKTSTPLTPL
ncbi:hypothetical protein L6452_42381 [Arctium lappa]|uniref:Uncharacterized protein n=5 Tax=Arctium lappa TaxID=4217 RepID=A0ACB8XM59_ARCLA|nr:hypothetical protein L6452_42372 [Arctium lappa]KAI3667321.1 hypothetical protein L6452_42374 [Arctium lappa]KAI3667323.1 hypothetical protein L6452_42376 [Arctium lappa]KAI3667326.1 hypothetical protein L6452_42379 [Arctium lappa]KAI3667328.1 hypothetical protein L6452_42381 [Arctium lappa]